MICYDGAKDKICFFTNSLRFLPGSVFSPDGQGGGGKQGGIGMVGGGGLFVC
jgi:hypothetical protein